MDILSGLLGGVQGGASAVSELSDERRRELAEAVKAQALEAIMQRREQRQFGHEKTMQDERFQGQAELQKASIQGQSELQDARLQNQAGMQTQRLKSAEGLLGQRLSAKSATGGSAGGGVASKPKITTKDYHKQTNDIYESLRESGWEEGQEIPSLALKQINELRSDAGKPPLTPKENQETVPGKRFWNSDTTSTTYQYDDGVLAPQGEETPEVEEVQAEEAVLPKEEAPVPPPVSTGSIPQANDPEGKVAIQEPQSNDPDGEVPAQKVDWRAFDPQKEVSDIAIKFGVDPNSIGRHKKRIWEKLSKGTKAQYGSYENFAKMVK